MKNISMILMMITLTGCIGPCAPMWQRWNSEARVIELTEEGRARLEEAKNRRQIIVEQAKAEVDAAKMRAQAIKIVGQAAKDYPEYRLQEFMGAFGEALVSDKIDQIIYVPTEGNIPILEASKRK